MEVTAGSGRGRSRSSCGITSTSTCSGTSTVVSIVVGGTGLACTIVSALTTLTTLEASCAGRKVVEVTVDNAGISKSGKEEDEGGESSSELHDDDDGDENERADEREGFKASQKSK